ncbi:hypothetical protein ACVW1C_000398 [Bradyrhizobium sp. USDA 4011]
MHLRHCEEFATKLQGNFALKRRSNPSIRIGAQLDCFASLAMTAGRRTRTGHATRVWVSALYSGSASQITRLRPARLAA